MTLTEVFNVVNGSIPPGIKDLGFLLILLSLVEISPLKLNPWQWLKAFYCLPRKLEKLETEFNKDRVFRWRSMILRRADYVRNGEKFSQETWSDTIETIDRYDRYCARHPEIKNGKAVMATEFLKDKYKEVFAESDFLL